MTNEMMGLKLSHIAVFGHFAATVVGLVVIVWLTKSRATSRRTVYLLLACVAVLAIAGFVASDPQVYFSDFRFGYYAAGRAVLDRPGALRPLTDIGVVGFASMPIVAYLFAPLALLPLWPAVAIFTGVGVLAIVAAGVMLARLENLGPTERWLLALLFVANGPLLYSLKEGNMTHIVLLALVVGLALMRSGRSLGAGILLGATTVIKPVLILLWLFFALRRDFRAAISFAVVFGAAVLASIAVFGWTDNLNWFEVCILQYSRQWVAAFNDQSVPSFLFRLHALPDLIMDWNSFPPPAGLRLPAQGLTAALYAVVLVACIRIPERGGPDLDTEADLRRDLQYLLVISLAIVASPLAWSHYYAWLLLPAALFLGTRAPALHFPLARALGWIAILLVTPLVRPLMFANEHVMSAYWQFFVSNFLFGGLVWLALLAVWLSRTGGLLRGKRGGPSGRP